MVTATASKPRATVKPVTLGKLIDTQWELREEKRAAEEVVKAIEAKIAANESILFERLDAEDTIKGEGKSASASITSTTSFNITDFDAFAEYVRKNKYFHLFQRRVSETAAREIFESKGALPGLTPFTKRRINIRSLKSA
jgi:hypothetical protein